MGNKDQSSGKPPRVVPPDAPGAVFNPTPGATPIPSPLPQSGPNGRETALANAVEQIISTPRANNTQLLQAQDDKSSGTSTPLPATHIPSDGVLIHTAGTGKPPRLMVYDVGGRRLHAHHLRPARRQEKLTRMLKDLFKRHDESSVRGNDANVRQGIGGPDSLNGTPPPRGAAPNSAAGSAAPSQQGSQPSSQPPSRPGSPALGKSDSSFVIPPGGNVHHRSNSEEVDRDAADAVAIACRGDKPPSLLSVLAQQLKSKDTKPEDVLNEILSQRNVAADPSLVDRYGHLSSIVGKGSFGVVRLAQKADPRNKNRKLVYAVKEFHPNSQESESKYLKRLASEFCLASSLHHTNIIQTLDLLKDGRKYCGVMEFCAGGDLYSLIVVAGRLESTEADCFFKQIMRGISYMHEMGVAHRDLKPENVLLTSRGCCKLTDFGNAECFRMAWERDVHLSSSLAGSGPYIAPEEYKKQAFDPRAVDVWAAGVIYMAMCTGRHLWHEAKQHDNFFMKYLSGRKDEHGYEPIERLKMSKRRNVIYSVLDPVASRRLTAKQVLNSEWSREIAVCEAGEGDIHH